MHDESRFFSRARSGLTRVRWVAAQTLTEALRLRLTGLLVLAAALLVLMALRVREFNFGFSELKFISDFGLGAMSLMGTVLAALSTAHLFFNDITGGVIGCLLTRSVRRWEFLGGKIVGIMALLGLFVMVQALVLSAVLAWRGYALGAEYSLVPVWQAGVLVWLKVTLVAAMTLLVCTYAGSMLFAACMGLLLAAVGQLRPLAAGGGSWSWLRCWPNLGLFDAEPLLAGGRVETLGLFGYWAVFMILLTAISAYVFQSREF